MALGAYKTMASKMFVSKPKIWHIIVFFLLQQDTSNLLNSVCFSNLVFENSRSTFSPIFSSGKMRGMYKFMDAVGNKLADQLIIKAEQKDDFEYKV